MLRLAAAVTVVLLPAIVHAEPTAYVQADAMVGAAVPIAGFNLMRGIEAGYHLSTSPFWVRGVAATGTGEDDQGSGTNRFARAGLEARTCTQSGVACFVAATDVGYQSGSWQKSDDPAQHEAVQAVVVTPRIGLDLGDEHVRFRLAIEWAEAASEKSTTMDRTGTTVSHEGGGVGGELVAGAAYQW